MKHEKKKYRAMDFELKQLSEKDTMLRQLWSDLEDLYLDGNIGSDEKAFMEALEMSKKY
ncbi:MAG: hypothetical protein U9Q84_06410 [Thermodesulfobacteriota bacterium]|nr:hypothetical protein [Thermodesulfobacteriota bacterium]